MSTFPWNCPAGKLDSEVKARIIRAQNQMCQFQLFYFLNLSQWLFAISDNLSKTVQKESMSALSGLHLAELRPFRKCNQMKKLSYFSKLSRRKLLIILSSRRLHYCIIEKGQTMVLSITTFKLKDIAIMQTHVIPLLWKNTSGNNILKTLTLSYHHLKIISITCFHGIPIKGAAPAKYHSQQKL